DLGRDRDGGGGTRLVRKLGDRFDLEQELGTDEGADLDQRAGGTVSAEELLPDRVDERALVDVAHEDGHLRDVGWSGAGRVAVVTGSSGGIGLAIATEFAREGASVVVNSRDAERAEKAASTLAQEGLHVSGFAADMRRPEEARALAEAAVARHGRLDIWVNNAGINVIKPALELEADEWAGVIDTNLSACFYGSQAAGRLMVP